MTDAPVIKLTGGPEDSGTYQLAARLVAEGRLIAFPTDTFYALGADPYNGEAMAALYRLKGRPGDKPVLLLIGEASWAGRLWGDIPPGARLLMERFWPGPLTIICPPGPEAPRLPGGRGLALRLPGNPLTAALLGEVGRPLTGTSANPSGLPPPRSAAEAAGYFPEGLALVLDGGTYPGSAGSTMVETTMKGARLVREGEIPAALVRECLGAAGGL